MCWTTSKIPIRRIAKKDIKVKKLLFHSSFYKRPISPFKFFLWNIGVLNTTSLEKPKNIYNHWEINLGFHSCADIVRHQGYLCTGGWYWSSVYYEGWWIFKKKCYSLPISSCNGESIYNAIIPKGAEYYENEFGEYVSNQLKIID